MRRVFQFLLNLSRNRHRVTNPTQHQLVRDSPPLAQRIERTMIPVIALHVKVRRLRNQIDRPLFSGACDCACGCGFEAGSNHRHVIDITNRNLDGLVCPHTANRSPSTPEHRRTLFPTVTGTIDQPWRPGDSGRTVRPVVPGRADSHQPWARPSGTSLSRMACAPAGRAR